MSSSVRALAVGFALLCFSQATHAMTVVQAESVLAEVPLEYLDASDHGKLCELIGVQVMKDLYPGATVYNGVVYKKKNLTVGELDLVVMQGEKIVDVTEVKCWENFRRASHKADEQIDRLETHLKTCDVNFTIDGKTLPCSLFSAPGVHFGKMSYTDAHPAGFDHDLTFSRQQILSLIKDLRSKR